LILLSISILAIVISVLVYRRQPLELILRLASIVCIYLLISNYSLTINEDAPPSKPIVLVDYSMSMAHSIPRILDAVSKIDFPHELFFFNENLLTDIEPQHPGSYTDMTRAIMEADKMQPSIMLLITDGNHNFGASPLTILDGIKAPVYIYGIGEETPRDVSIIDITSPKYAHLGDSIQITVIVASSGFSAGTGQMALYLASGKKLATQIFPLSSTPARRRLDLWYVAADTGASRLRVNIEPQPDEISYDNNRANLSLEVLKQKIMVLYYTDHISFNTKFLLESLSRDANLSVSSIVDQGSGKYSRVEGGYDVNALQEPAGFDVVILDNANLARIPWTNLPGLLNNGKGIVLIGKIEGLNEQWRNITPINTTAGILEGTHKIEITEPFSVLSDGDYPPARNVNRIVSSKQDATVLARTNNLPVIGFRQQGKGRIFQICIGDLGTWNFLQRGLKNKDLLNDFIGDVVRFLSPMGTHTRLMLETKKRDHAVGETMHLTLQSYDRNFRSAGGGDFFLVADGAIIPFYETRHGSYEADVVLQETGVQHMFAQGEIDGDTLRSNAIDVNITPRSDETEQRLNRVLLESIATQTDGKFLTLDELTRTTPPDTERRKASKVINLNSPVIYFAVLIMLTADWILRRRRGIT
jgi:hypothetical protein